jgi:tetratricopeptide (TPR) repeat protein
VVQVLSLFSTPLPTESLLIGAGPGGAVTDPKVSDAIEQLVDDALVQRVFDASRNDYCYTLLPITRAFVYAQVVRDQSLEASIRNRLSDWFEARDVRVADERLAIRASRQGKGDPEVALVDLGIAQGKRGDIDAAERLLEQALQRNPKSWRAAKELAELRRHVYRNISEALRLYDQAAANAPRTGVDRGLIFRERGILLSQSGTPDATDRAIESLQIANEESPNDAIAAHALSNMLVRSGRYRKAVALLEPLTESGHTKTRDLAMSTLARAYEACSEIVKLGELRSRAKKLGVNL